MLSTSDSTGRLDVYGGTFPGWEALITSAGAGILGSGRRLVVVDLSEGAVAAELIQLARAHGLSANAMLLPQQMEEADLLSGLSADEVSDVLLEAFHGGAEQVSDEVRGMDARILGAICESLNEPYTVARIAAGLRVLLDQEQRPREGRPGMLTAEEFDRVAELFGVAFRQSMQQRVVALEAGLHHLRRFGDSMLGRPLLERSQLQVVAVTKEAPSLLSDRLAHLLPQLLIRAARNAERQQAGETVLVIAGADRIRRRHLEKLEELSRTRHVRLVYMFKHLREDALDLLGASGSAVFMRVGNANEARNAAEFIGREHSFKLSSVTTSTDTSVSDSAEESTSYSVGNEWGRNYSWALGLLPSHSPTGGSSAGRSIGRQWGQSSGSSRSTSTGESGTYERVYEFSVEPRTLQTLPETAFMLVDSHGAGDRLVRLGDCNPNILTLPRVSPEALPE